MGKMSREKGKRGEREFAAILRKMGFSDARRTAQFCGKPGTAADVVGVHGLHFEVKRCERIQIMDWMHQAMVDSAMTNDIPVVAMKKNCEPWLVTMLATDFLMIYKEMNK